MNQSSRLGSLSSGLDMKAGMLIMAVFAEPTCPATYGCDHGSVCRAHVSSHLWADCADNQAEFTVELPLDGFQIKHRMPS